MKFFGWAKDIAGCGERSLACPDAMSAAEFWNELSRAYPALAGRKEQCVLAVNYEYATAASVVHDGDEVAVIPPVSGG
ncbi:MAG TPA: MoaD/ThiS family protein [Candidatus Kapabacteria bacterium]|nr:MoaD/ThiS family protein [Candidatus Kapabacteria bacterium]